MWRGGGGGGFTQQTEADRYSRATGGVLGHKCPQLPVPGGE
jgi:hypothetical protein